MILRKASSQGKCRRWRYAETYNIIGKNRLAVKTVISSYNLYYVK